MKEVKKYELGRIDCSLSTIDGTLRKTIKAFFSGETE